MQITTAKIDRKRAALFYLGERNITGGMNDWIDSGVLDGYAIDSDIQELAQLLALVRLETIESMQQPNEKPSSQKLIWHGNHSHPANVRCFACR